MILSQFSGSPGGRFADRSAALALPVSILIFVSSVFSASIPSDNKRFLNPCSGSKVIRIALDDAEAVDEGANSSSHPVTIAFRELSERATRLKRSVRDLKKLYVTVRFRDESLVEDLEQSGFKIQGMPEVHHPTLETVANKDVISLVHSAFESLARVAVFLDQARIGENLSQNERGSFAEHFERLENDSENGLYWIMCALNQIIRYSGQHLRHDALTNVMNMKVAEVDRNALRHARDYLVLRDFEKLLDVFRIDFAAIDSFRVIRK